METFEEAEYAVAVDPPRSGLGRSDGRGTYAKYKKIVCAQKMRFEPFKNIEPQLCFDVSN